MRSVSNAHSKVTVKIQISCRAENSSSGPRNGNCCPLHLRVSVKGEHPILLLLTVSMIQDARRSLPSDSHTSLRWRDRYTFLLQQHLGMQSREVARKPLFTRLTGLSEGSIPSRFLSSSIFFSRYCGDLPTCWSYPSATFSSSALMGYHFHKRVRRAEGHG